MAYVNFNSGDGSFRKGNNYVAPGDPFGFGEGLKKLLNKGEWTDGEEEEEKEPIKHKHDELVSVPFDGDSPFEKETGKDQLP